MIDFRIVQAKTMLKVRSVAPVRGFVPKSIVVVGEDMNLATEVYFNGSKVDDFIISSPSRLLVKIPPTMVGKELRDIQVFSSVRKPGLDAAVEFKIANPFQTLQGIERLAQVWLMIFMTTPGSDIFSPSSGGGAQTIIGRNTDSSNKGISADLQLSIETTNSELLSAQASNPRTPLSEKLLSTDLQSLQFNDDKGGATALIVIQNVLGQRAGLNL